MKEGNYKFDAFISYRHCDLDKFVAENLQKKLETYTLPKNVRKKFNIEEKGIKRIFRDRDELPLSSNLEDPILEAINSSKYLIVICSPRLKASQWCKKEIQTFKKLRGRKNIFCVLIEGEPDESFPEEVLYDEIITKDKNGKEKITKVPVEPLAADVRGENKKEVLKKINEEKLRLVAPIFDLDYNDLKQRQRERKMKKIIYSSILIASLCFLFTVYSSIMFMKISSQQKTLKKHQAITLTKNSEEYVKKDSKYNAIKSAYQSLTKFEGVKMPYTTDAQYALTNATRLYDTGKIYKAEDELFTKGIIDNMKINDNLDKLLSYDESDTLTLWDLKKNKKIKDYNNTINFTFNEKSYSFIGNDLFAYVNNNKNVVIVNTKDGKVIDTVKDLKAYYVQGDNNGKYILINTSKKVYLYNIEKKEIIGDISYKNAEFDQNMLFTPDSNKVILFTYDNATKFENYQKLNLIVLNTNKFKEENNFKIDARYIEKARFDDKNMYLLANQSKDIMDENMFILSYNYNKNETNWTEEYKNSWGNNINISYAENSNSIIIFDNASAYVLDKSNGKELDRYSIGEKTVGCITYLDYDQYLYVTSSGVVHTINTQKSTDIVFTNYYQLNLDKYIQMLVGENGLYLIPENDNRIIKYSQNKSKKIKESNYTEKESPKYLVNEDKEKYIKEYNIEKNNLIKNIIFNKENKIMFVSYTDKTVNVYDTKTKKKIANIKDIDEINIYLGKDKNGNTYVTNTSVGYILNKDYQKIAKVDGLIGINKKKNIIYITNSGVIYESPIYSLDDILKYAKDYLK